MVCSVVGCQTGSPSYRGEKFTLYKFRTSDRLKKLWTEQLNRAGFTPSKSSVICAKHFAENAFEPTMTRSQGRKRKVRQLKPFAIPTLFLRPSQTSEEESDLPSAPQPSSSATTSTTVEDHDHSYSTGGDKNDVDHNSLDSMVLNEIVVDNSQKEPAKQNPPQTSSREVIDLQQSNEALLARIQELEQENAELSQIKAKLETIWTKDMVRKMMLPSSSTMHFSSKAILECILIYYRIGQTAYEMLRKKGYPYPSLSTLQNHLRQVDCVPGILDDFFVFIKNQMDHLEEEHQKISILCGDEMSLRAQFEYNTTTQEYCGTPTMSKPPPKPRKPKKGMKRKSEVQVSQPQAKKTRKTVEPLDEHDIPDLDEDSDDEFEENEEPVFIESDTTADSTAPKKLPLAVHAMSLMLCGLTKRWKNIIGFHFTDVTFCPKECAEFYRQAIRKSYEAGSKVKALVMDMSGQNLNV